MHKRGQIAKGYGIHALAISGVTICDNGRDNIFLVIRSYCLVLLHIAIDNKFW